MESPPVSRPASPIPSGSGLRALRALRAERADAGVDDLDARFAAAALGDSRAPAAAAPPPLLMPPPPPPPPTSTPASRAAANAGWLADVAEFLRGKPAVRLAQLGVLVPPPPAARRGTVPVSKLLARDARFAVSGAGHAMAVSLRDAAAATAWASAAPPAAAAAPAPAPAPPANTAAFAESVLAIVRARPGISSSALGNALRQAGVAAPPAGLLKAASRLPGVVVARDAAGHPLFSIAGLESGTPAAAPAAVAPSFAAPPITSLDFAAGPAGSAGAAGAAPAPAPPAAAPDFAESVLAIVRERPGVSGSALGSALRQAGVAAPSAGLLKAASRVPGVVVTRDAAGHPLYSVSAGTPAALLGGAAAARAPAAAAAAGRGPSAAARAPVTAATGAAGDAAAADGAGAAAVAAVLADAAARGGTRMVAIAKALRGFRAARGVSARALADGPREGERESIEESLDREVREGALAAEAAARFRGELRALYDARRDERARAGAFAAREFLLDELNAWLAGFGRDAAPSTTQASDALRAIHANIYDVMDANFKDHGKLAKLARYTIAHKLVFVLKDAKEMAVKIFLKPLKRFWGR
jgi:hypothetical protein